MSNEIEKYSIVVSELKEAYEKKERIDKAIGNAVELYNEMIIKDPASRLAKLLKSKLLFVIEINEGKDIANDLEERLI